LQRLNQIRAQWNVKIFEQTPARFEELALEAFRYQYALNQVYRQFTDALRIDPTQVNALEKIPFLPVSFFKSSRVLTAPDPEGRLSETEQTLRFESSGTTGTLPSVHLVQDPGLYQKSFCNGFERTFGLPERWCLLALLPSYLEREHSSLVYMTRHLIEQTDHPHSGFYLHDYEKLHATLFEREQNKQATLLLGVSFALLEFAERFPMALNHTQLIETGGMKGRGPELTREELHHRLQKAFGLYTVCSEYGMTELLSQAWSTGKGLFKTPPWMKVMVREEEDPLSVRLQGTGALNIIDLANIDSCCFIATEDIGLLHPQGHFEVRGRMDHAEWRGCSLLML